MSKLSITCPHLMLTRVMIPIEEVHLEVIIITPYLVTVICMKQYSPINTRRRASYIT